MFRCVVITADPDMREEGGAEGPRCGRRNIHRQHKCIKHRFHLVSAYFSSAQRGTREVPSITSAFRALISALPLLLFHPWQLLSSPSTMNYARPPSFYRTFIICVLEDFRSPPYFCPMTPIPTTGLLLFLLGPPYFYPKPGISSLHLYRTWFPKSKHLKLARSFTTRW